MRGAIPPLLSTFLWRSASLSRYVFVVWCLVKHGNTLPTTEETECVNRHISHPLESLCYGQTHVRLRDGGIKWYNEEVSPRQDDVTRPPVGSACFLSQRPVSWLRIEARYCFVYHGYASLRKGSQWDCKCCAWEIRYGMKGQHGCRGM